MTYTPQESMATLRYFYEELGGEIWGRHGFVDAFNRSQGWVANSNLAIDQGPVVVMIENHRSGTELCRKARHHFPRPCRPGHAQADAGARAQIGRAHV